LDVVALNFNHLPYYSQQGEKNHSNEKINKELDPEMLSYHLPNTSFLLLLGYNIDKKGQTKGIKKFAKLNIAKLSMSDGELVDHNCSRISQHQKSHRFTDFSDQNL
jgi:hypothetical protein